MRLSIAFPVVRTYVVRSRDYQIFSDGKIILAMGLRYNLTPCSVYPNDQAREGEGVVTYQDT